jgi:hypothetical protein
MSDYLGHLIERTSAPNAGVRPRIPSIFQPPDPIVGEGPLVPEDSPQAQTPPRAATIKTSEVSLEMVELQESPITRPTGHGQKSGETYTPMPSAAIDRPLDLRADDISKPRTTAAPSVHANQAPGENLPRVPTTIRPVVYPSRAGAENVSSAPAAQTHSQEKIEARQAPITMTPELDQNDDSPKSPRPPALSGQNPDSKFNGVTIRPARPVHETDLSPAAIFSKRGAMRPMTNSVSAPPPSIPVTIGRLEVRASASPAILPRAKTKQGPAMSLEAYLQRRAEGGRR